MAASVTSAESPSKLNRVVVVVPVFNHWSVATACIEKLCSDEDRYQILVIDDHSKQDMSRDLVAKFEHRITYRRNPRNLGYTRSVNWAISNSDSDLLVLCNSDCLVPNSWLPRMKKALSREQIAAAGPLSNAATWQSVPKRFENNKWCVNPLPPGLDVDQMDRMVNDLSDAEYPQVPLLNGFFLGLKRSAINAIGDLDEKSFPVGYGEENDYCIRLAEAGFGLSLIDNLYVFHHKSTSFGHLRRRWLSLRGGVVLNRKWGAQRIGQLTEQMSGHATLAKMRRRVADSLANEK